MRIFTTLLFAFASIAFSNTALAMTEYIDVAVGDRSVCAIDTENRLECATIFERDRYLPPDDGTTYTEVALGNSHSCAITTSGTIRCWGQNTFGQLDVPTASVPFVSIVAGENHSCATDANLQMHCWGLNTNEQTSVPVAENYGFVSAYAGENGSCGIRDTGQAVCWSTEESYNNVDPNARYIDLVAGGGGSSEPSCGLTTEGNIDCWFLSPHVETPIPNNGPYTNIETNFAMLCGLTQSGKVDCAARQYESSRLNETAAADIAEFEGLPPLKKFSLAQSNLASSLCGISLDNQIYCAGFNLPFEQLPGAEAVDYEVQELGVTYYSDTTVELLWSLDASARNGNNLLSGFNIYRDDQLLTFTQNNASYIDDALQRGVNYNYSIAAVDLSGNESQRSYVITVNTADRNEGSAIDPGGPAQPIELEALSLTRYGENSLELFWVRPDTHSSITYQVYRNGNLVASVPGTSFFDDSVSQAKDWHYTVIAINGGSNMVAIDFVNALSDDATACR